MQKLYTGHASTVYMARKRQIGIRIDDSGEIAEAWDEYRQDYENKSSALRQLMRRGLEIDGETDDAESAERDTQTDLVESLSVGGAAAAVAWLAATAASVGNLLTISAGALVVSGVVIVGFAATVFHLRTNDL
jgi:hypothetical protein